VSIYYKGRGICAVADAKRTTGGADISQNFQRKRQMFFLFFFHETSSVIIFLNNITAITMHLVNVVTTTLAALVHKTFPRLGKRRRLRLSSQKKRENSKSG
jgi:hypothetical protein